MESAQNIKRRLKSINNIGQITKAMELVAATKMRKSQEIALASRPYAYATLDLLARISGQEFRLPEILRKREIKKMAIVLVTSDKGLAGSFNSAVTRLFEKYVRDQKINVKDSKYTFIAIGKKAASYFQSKGIAMKEKFVRVGDFVTPDQTYPISDLLSKGYQNKDWDEVLLFSTYFMSALKQEVLIRQIFPIELENIKKALEDMIPKTGKFADMAKEIKSSNDSSKIDRYLIEPSRERVLKLLIEHLIRMQFYHLILETNASEHAARRMAMKSASDNAKDLFSELNIVYNKSRQARITTEISEIVSGIESLNK